VTNTFQSLATITVPIGTYAVSWTITVNCTSAGTVTQSNFGLSTSTSSISISQGNVLNTAGSLTYVSSGKQSYSGTYFNSATSATTLYLVYNLYVSTGTFTISYTWQLLKIA
jgi:hypothetical protein